jgi:hypothetical protein
MNFFKFITVLNLMVSFGAPMFTEAAKKISGRLVGLVPSYGIFCKCHLGAVFGQLCMKPLPFFSFGGMAVFTGCQTGGK